MKDQKKDIKDLVEFVEFEDQKKFDFFKKNKDEDKIKKIDLIE